MDEHTTPPRPPFAAPPVAPGAPGARAARDPELEAGWDEDFLYHLSRGSEFLLDDRVVEAKEELERALEYRPEDAKGQDLLAGSYFRLGVYPRAIEIWRRLVRRFPDDPTLRVNLGLVLFKTGQPDDALAHLEHALSVDPEHARAWGYYGLVQWRLGRLPEAREAFSRGGQAAMARRMEDELRASSAGSIAAPPSAPPSAPAPVAELASERDRAQVRTTADAAIDRLHAEEAPLVVEAVRERRITGQWRVVEAGADAIPRTSQPRRPTAVDAPMSLGALVDWWAPSIPAGEPLVVSPTGLLLVSTRGAVHARRTGMLLVRGAPRIEEVARRFRRGPEETLGGDEPILRWSAGEAAGGAPGELLAVAAPESGQRFQAIRVEDDVLYVVERFVHAFDDRIELESGRLPELARGPARTESEGEEAGGERLVLFRGSGTVVLRMPRPPTAIAVRAGDDARVTPGSLLGWTGRLFPLAPEDVRAGTEAGGAEGGAATIALRGDGTVLLV